jgi:hypothetical protein
LERRLWQLFRLKVGQQASPKLRYGITVPRVRRGLACLHHHDRFKRDKGACSRAPLSIPHSANKWCVTSRTLPLRAVARHHCPAKLMRLPYAYTVGTDAIRIPYGENTDTIRQKSIKSGIFGGFRAVQGIPPRGALTYKISVIFTVRPVATDFSAASASASAISPSSPDGAAGFPLDSAAIKLAISAA